MECKNKKINMVQIRLDSSQKERLKKMASAEGFSSLSDYIRNSLLNPTIDYKLNLILERLNRQGDRK